MPMHSTTPVMPRTAHFSMPFFRVDLISCRSGCKNTMPYGSPHDRAAAAAYAETRLVQARAMQAQQQRLSSIVDPHEKEWVDMCRCDGARALSTFECHMRSEGGCGMLPSCPRCRMGQLFLRGEPPSPPSPDKHFTHADATVPYPFLYIIAESFDLLTHFSVFFCPLSGRLQVWRWKVVGLQQLFVGVQVPSKLSPAPTVPQRHRHFHHRRARVWRRSCRCLLL